MHCQTPTGPGFDSRLERTCESFLIRGGMYVWWPETLLRLSPGVSPSAQHNTPPSISVARDLRSHADLTQSLFSQASASNPVTQKLGLSLGHHFIRSTSPRDRHSVRTRHVHFVLPVCPPPSRLLLRPSSILSVLVRIPNPPSPRPFPRTAFTIFGFSAASVTVRIEGERNPVVVFIMLSR